MASAFGTRRDLLLVDAGLPAALSLDRALLPLPYPTSGVVHGAPVSRQVARLLALHLTSTAESRKSRCAPRAVASALMRAGVDRIFEQVGAHAFTAGHTVGVAKQDLFRNDAVQRQYAVGLRS